MATENISILKLNVEAGGTQSVSQLLTLIEQLKQKMQSLKDGTADYASIVKQLKTINKELGESFVDLGKDMSTASENVDKIVSSLKDVISTYQKLGNANINPEVVSQMQQLSDAVVTLSQVASMDDLAQQTDNLGESLVQLTSNTDMTALSTEELKKKIESLTVSLSESNTTTDETVEQVAELISAYREFGQRGKEVDDTVRGNVTSYKELTMQMRELKKIWRETTDEATRAKIGERIVEINDQLKSLDATIGNYQRNVGNYSGAMADFSKVVLRNLGNVDPALNRMGMNIASLIPLIKKATAAARTGLTGIKAAIASTGVGILVIALGEILANFDKIKEKVASSIPYFRRMREEIEGIRANGEKLVEWAAGSYDQAQQDITHSMELEAAKRNGISSEELERERQRISEELELRRQVAEETDRAYTEEIKKIGQLETELERLEKLRKSSNFIGKAIWGKEIEKVNAELEVARKKAEQIDKNGEDAVSRVKTLERQLEILNNRPIKAIVESTEDIAERMKRINDEIRTMTDNFRTSYDNLIMTFLNPIEQLKRSQEQSITLLKTELDMRRLILEENGLLTEEHENQLHIDEQLIDRITTLYGLNEQIYRKNREIEKVQFSISEVEATRPKNTEEYLNSLIEANRELETLYKELSNPEEFMKSIGLSMEQMKDLDEYIPSLFNTDEIEKNIHDVERLIEDFVFSLKNLDITQPLIDIENQMQNNLLDNFDKYNEDYKKLLDDRVEAQREYITKINEIGRSPEESITEFNNRLEQENIRLKEFMKEQADWIDENTRRWVSYANTIADAFHDMLSSWGDGLYDLISVQAEAGKISEAEYNKQFEAMKGVQIAAATIQTIAGAVGAFLQASANYVPPYGQILGGITAAAVTATGVAEIAKIQRTTPGNTNRPSWGTTTDVAARPRIEEYTPQFTQNVTGQNEVTDLVNALTDRPLRAFVVESDITSAQELSKKRERESTF